MPLEGSLLVVHMLVAGVVTALSIIVLLRFRHWLPVDEANQRSLHVGTVSRFGGIGIFLGAGVALVLARVSEQQADDANIYITLLCAIGLLVVSLRDDWRPLPVIVRLMVHSMAAGWVVWMLTPAPHLHFVLWMALVWMTNLFNFMDGADGLAGGMAVFGFAAYGLAAWPTNPALAQICLLLAAAVAGFMWFNFSPAKVFLGDVGSIPLGFLAGALGLVGWHATTWPAWFPLLVFSPFIFDASVTLLQRLWKREKFWKAHNKHCYQRLVRMGWSHRKVSLTYYCLMGVAAIAAHLALQLSKPVMVTSLAAIFLAAYLWLLFWVEIKWRNFHQPDGCNNDATEHEQID
jgi:UDP-N-acetylmuramyl pentapeptide phosphotransferase/UDP-N-acetylglucosamine-1-phosphate transferase